MNLKPSQHSLISLNRHLLFVTMICYLPHIVTQPWWLYIIFLGAISYRLTADYFSYPPLPRWFRFILVIVCLSLLSINIRSSEFIIRFLLIFIILKCIEIHTVRDVKALILCNFFLIFSALLIIQELWIIFYLLVAIIANLSIMLKVSAPQAFLRQLISKSSQQLLIAIPLGILLFYLFPRIDPLWHLPTLSKATTGFNEKMSFGSISELFNDDSVVMQILFKKNIILKGYWRGIILNYYNGESWLPSWYNYFSFYPLQALKESETADYEILLEPNQSKWLFYVGYPIAGMPNLLFSSNHGLIRQNKDNITQRFLYSLKIKPAPYHVLGVTERAEATQLPLNFNPRLTAWAKEQFAKSNNNIPAFINFLHNYIYHHSFWYTTTPPTLNSTKNQMDSFWFETQKGFCEHYASAVTFILRSVGIPARVVIGYQGGRWNPIARSITIKRSDAHAWLEYWQEGIGWRQLDPTTFIALQRIDQTIRMRQSATEEYLNISSLSWQQKFEFYLESARFYSGRWFLFYNQDTQRNLLQHVGLGQWNTGELLQLSIGLMILFFTLLGIYYQWWQKRTLDTLLHQYHLLQKEFRKFNISTHPSATLNQQCKLLVNKAPGLSAILSSFLHRYEQLRLKQSQTKTKENKKETIALFKSLRYLLRQHKP